jgi:hypothetical protein
MLQDRLSHRPSPHHIMSCMRRAHRCRRRTRGTAAATFRFKRSCCDMLAEDRTQSRRCRSSSHRVGRSSDRSGGCAGVPKSTWHHVHERSEARKGCGGCAPLTLTPLCCYWDQPRTRWLPHVGIVAGRPNDSSVLSVRATSLGGRYVLNPAGREVRPDCHHCATRLGSPARAVRRYVPHPRF